MSETILKLHEICGENTYTRDDAVPLYNKIRDGLLAGNNVTVDFEEKEISSESFLDEAIVEHYIHPKVPNAAKKITLKNVLGFDKSLMARIYNYRKEIEDKQLKKAQKATNATHSIIRDSNQDSSAKK
ncbi:MAG TPA: DUF4325 domain-containing protein [Elusimicrobiota bacterium]|nr:DUF4325 domain-containing protein [Elusimicrobiota bacterium]